MIPVWSKMLKNRSRILTQTSKINFIEFRSIEIYHFLLLEIKSCACAVKNERMKVKTEESPTMVLCDETGNVVTGEESVLS